MPEPPRASGTSVSAHPSQTGAPGQADGAPSADALQRRMREALAADGGWWPFDRFMAAALYTPGLGYYARSAGQIGWLPRGGSDFVTAPVLSPWFGRALAVQLREALLACGSDALWEFGAGTGALAEQLIEALDALGTPPSRYTIVELSGALQARQRERLARFGDRVRWLETWPQALHGVVVGNEVLDAMPVRLLHFDGARWFERGVAWNGGRWVHADRPTDDRPPHEGPFLPGTVTEVHDQATAFVRSLAERLARGFVLLIDYGFPQAEYYHPQRTGGTLMCHRAHRSDADPLVEVGEKDITAHVDFTAVALAAQDAGLDVLGYTSQGRFLINCGLPAMLETASLPERAAAQKLLTEHEMGELFKVLALGRGIRLDPLGFAVGDRMHRL